MSRSHHRRHLVGFALALGLVVLAMPVSAQEKAPPSGKAGPVPLAPVIPYGVAVTPDGGTRTRPPSSSGHVETFRVQNTGSNTQTYAISCLGFNAVTCTSTSPTSVTLAGGFSSNVNAIYRVAASGSGRLRLRAFGMESELSDTGYVNVTVQAAPVYSVAMTPDNGTEPQRVEGVTYPTSFGIRNAGTVTDTYSFSCTSANGVTCQSVSPTTLTLSPGASTTVSVTYKATAPGTGTLTLRANGTGVSDPGSYSVPVIAAIAVTPDGGTTEPRLVSTGGYSEPFTVTNRGPQAATYSITCVGSSNVTCNGTSASSLTLAAGDSTSVMANYSVGAAGTGRLTLTASNAAASNDGFYSVPVVAPTPQAPGVALNGVNPGATVERSVCLTVAIGAGAAAECGDLRIVHALPSTRTLNKTRTPVLLYNSQFAHPYPLIAALVTLPATASVPDSVTGRVTINSVEKVKGKWAGSEWSTARTRRVVLGFDGLSELSGTPTYTLEVRNWYGTTSQPTTVTGQLAIVNRNTSAFGAGWWLAGYEGLQVGTMVWTGGDGSVRTYVPVAGMTNVWVAPSMDHPDTLKKDANGNYIRYDKDSVRVTFGATGLHASTRNRQGHVTVFSHTSGLLTTVTLPPAGPGKFYQFAYVGGRLQSVTAPAPSPTSSRIVTITLDAGRVIGIQDPDTTAVSFTYTGASKRIGSRVDRLGVATTYGYDAGWRVQNSRLIMPAPAAPLTLQLTVAETRGLAGTASLDTAKVYTRIDGRRTDVADTTAVWLDRFGAPRKIADALGKVTTLRRDDPRWPAFVTSVTSPNGFTVNATYDNRGNIDTSTEVNPLGDGRNASTQYKWDAKWDAVTRITRPEGDSVNFFYDLNNGNRLWQRDGRGASTQVSFGFNTANQLQSITQPGATGSDVIGYDAMGNVNLITTPLGSKTRIINDDAGRVIKREIQVDVAASVWRAESLGYDAQDRVVRQVTTGPALNGTGQQTAMVQTLYTAEGQVDTIIRTSSSDPSALMRTTFAHDAAGRTVAEFAPDHSTTLVRVDSIFYDAAGNVLQSRNRLGQSVWSDYDALNRVIQTRTESVQYGYRYDGIPKQRGGLFATCREGTAVSDKPELCKFYPRLPNDGSTGYVIKADTAVFEYDEMGGLTQADNASAQVRRQYLRGGALSRDSLYLRTWAPLDSGGTFATHAYGLQLSYDLNGRRKTLTHPLQFGHLLGDATGTSTSVESYGYDPGHGQLSSVRNPMNVVWNIGLNLRGELATLSALQGAAAESFGYDADGNLVSDVINNSERQTTIGYDPRGLMTQVRNTVGDKDTLNLYYSGMGHLRADTVVAYGVDAFNRPLRYRGFETYTSDALGNRLSFDSFSDLTPEGGTPGATGPRVKRNYNYEAKTGRLVRAPDPGIPTQRDSTYYDAGGNIVFSTAVPSPQEDRASFYAGSGQLAASDWRQAVGPTLSGRWFFEEYKYDALGRRVAVLARRDCEGVNLPWDTECRLSWIRRTVWDGEQELWEVQMPLELMENDVNPVQLTGGDIQKTPFYGIVGYTNGLATDRPLGFIRVNYASQISSGPKLWQPFTLLPFYDVKGHPATVYFSDGTIPQCNDAQTSSLTHCVRLDWPFEWHAYRGYETIRLSWHGSILEDKRDATGTMYRRNRYYDPATGRFTQEDPIGLAGGINLYGFANGDPVNFSDPFGLKECQDRGNCLQGEVGEQGAAHSKAVAGLEQDRRGDGSVDDLGAVLLIAGGLQGALAKQAIATGTALVATRSVHGILGTAGRQITPAMQRKAIEVGTRYLDMKNPGTIAHVVEGGMASGRTLYVSSNGLGKVITSFVMRNFNPETLYNGALRWVPYP